MAHQLFRLREKVVNTPQLMHPASFETVIDYLDQRCSEGFDLSSDDVESFETARYAFNKELGVATLNIDGPLTYKSTMFQALCGGTSYEQLKEDFSLLVEQGAKTVALMVSSGGGEAYQLFPTASYIKNLAKENDVDLIAYVDGLSASAAYGLTSIADTIVMAPSSEVGSIGVVVRLMNDSKALEMNGYQRTFITAGASKVPFDAEGNFREGFLEDLQAKVDVLYEEFTDFVALNRNISVETVRSTEAKTFLPKDAVALGLADQVMTLEEFYEQLANSAQGKNKMLKSKIFNMSKDNVNEVDMTQLEAIQTELADVKSLLEGKEVELQAALEALPSLQASLEEATAELAVFKAEKEAAELAAKEAVAKARKAKLVAAIGEERAVELSATLEGVTEAQFDAVVSAFAATAVVEKKSALFTEMGSDTTVETNPSMEAALEQAIAKLNKSK